MQERKIVIVMGRCGRNKQGFGIRFERQAARAWAATWAFPLKEAAAKKEGYDQAKIEGSFAFDPIFPGCPHCHSQRFFVCGCGKVACFNSESSKATCPWCGSSGELGGVASSLAAGGDR